MKRYLQILLSLLFIKTIVVVWAIHANIIDLGPDEAQYWTWSQELDWGYYSKPPGVAWQIWLGTKTLGNTTLGVRLLSVVISFLTALAVYFLARACRLKANTAFWAGMVMAFSPLGILGAFLATTDGGMILFWTLCCIVMARALAGGTSPNYWLLGGLIAAGALFKWPIYLFWVFVFLGRAAYPPLRNRSVWGGLAVSLIGLLPSVVWNTTHEWATFQHVFTTVAGGHNPHARGNFLDFLGAQIGLLSPIFFVLLVLAFIELIRHRAKMWPSVVFCGAICGILLATYSAASLFQKMQGNWAVSAYPSGMVLLTWFACDKLKRGRGWLLGGTLLSVALTAGLLSLPSIQGRDLAPIPYAVNPFKHNIGWRALEKQLEESGYDPRVDFLFGDKYQMSSLMSFYSPGQKRAYFLNLLGTRQNQFSYWPTMRDEQMGKTGFFVVAENAPHLEKELPSQIEFYRKELGNYFAEVQFLGIRPLFSQGNRVVKGAAIFKCFNYNGKEPSPPKHY